MSKAPGDVASRVEKADRAWIGHSRILPHMIKPANGHSCFVRESLCWARLRLVHLHYMTVFGAELFSLTLIHIHVCLRLDLSWKPKRRGLFVVSDGMHVRFWSLEHCNDAQKCSVLVSFHIMPILVKIPNFDLQRLSWNARIIKYHAQAFLAFWIYLYLNYDLLI